MLSFVLIGTLLSMGGVFVHAQTATPHLILAATPHTINANTDCTFTVSQGWTCQVVLNRGDTSTQGLFWSVTGDPGIVFSPATGTLPAGGSAAVSINVPN